MTEARHWFGALKGCPKCGLAFKTLLHPFCENKGCPPRAWRKIMDGTATEEDRDLDRLWHTEVEASGALPSPSHGRRR